MARLDAGTFRSRPEPTPAADLFRATLESVTLLLAGRDVDVSVEPETPDLFVDPALTVEILANLLENAARATPAESPLALAAGLSPLDRGRVRLEVLDRGSGVPSAVKRELSADPGDTGRTGLGLTICRSLARALGGTVSLLDRTGGGTVARLDLPAAPGAPEGA
jgi:two-component system sensor histidine kinase KdpD